MVSQTLVTRLALDVIGVETVYHDSTGHARNVGDYQEENDALGNLVPGGVEAFYEHGGILIPLGVRIGVATNGPGFPEVTDIFAALTESKITTEASIDYTKLEEVGQLNVGINGSQLAIPVSQSIDQLVDGEARKRADSGLIVGVSEGGAKGHIFRNGRYVELVLCDPNVPGKIREVKKALDSSKSIGEYAQFWTPQYTLNGVIAKPGATKEELEYVGTEMYEIAKAIAPGLFQKTKVKAQNYRVYLIPQLLINGDGADKLAGVKLLHTIIGNPFDLEKSGYFADRILSDSEIVMIRDEKGRLGAFGMYIVREGVVPGEEHQPRSPGNHPALYGFQNGVDALQKANRAFEQRKAA